MSPEACALMAEQSHPLSDKCVQASPLAARHTSDTTAPWKRSQDVGTALVECALRGTGGARPRDSYATVMAWISHFDNLFRQPCIDKAETLEGLARHTNNCSVLLNGFSPPHVTHRQGTSDFGASVPARRKEVHSRSAAPWDHN